MYKRIDITIEDMVLIIPSTCIRVGWMVLELLTFIKVVRRMEGTGMYRENY